LKRANVHTLSDLLKYSPEELLEFKNFGQKSADEVSENLKKHFDIDLRKD
jgi:DNA-directed RNA polymerase subunit alpha